MLNGHDVNAIFILAVVAFFDSFLCNIVITKLLTQ
jgi:hypothetical protein